MVDQVRYRRAIGPAVALGVLGAVAGAALQNRYYYGSGYYGSGYAPGYYGGYGGPGYYGGYAGPGYYGPYGAYPYPYGYNYYGYGYGYDRSGAVAAGAAVGAIGAIIGAAARNPGAYRWGGYQYYDRAASLVINGLPDQWVGSSLAREHERDRYEAVPIDGDARP